MMCGTSCATNKEPNLYILIDLTLREIRVQIVRKLSSLGSPPGMNRARTIRPKTLCVSTNHASPLCSQHTQGKIDEVDPNTTAA